MPRSWSTSCFVTLFLAGCTQGGSSSATASSDAPITLAPTAAAPSAYYGAELHEDAYDFLVMNVCLDANGLATTGSPLACGADTQRDVSPNEAVAYSAGTWPDATRSAECGVISHRYSYPNATPGNDGTGKTYPLVLNWDDHGGGTDCTSGDHLAEFGTWNPNVDGVSNMTIQDGYASDLGSTGGSTLSLDFGSNYQSTSIEGIARFNRSWVFFPESIPAEGTTTTGQFAEHLVAVDGTDTSGVPAHDPSAQLDAYFSMQSHASFAFGSASDVVLDTIFESKYAGVDAAGESPGDGKDMERVYFTRQLGATRWEKWERDDLPGTTLADIQARAQTLYDRHVCGTPTKPTATTVTSHYLMGAVSDDGMYAQRVRVYDDSTSALVEHDWYLVDCDDWTYVQAQAPIVPASVVGPSTPGLTSLLALYVAP